MPPSAGPSSQSEVSLIPGHLATLKLPSLAPQTNPSLDVHRGWREHARRRGILLQGACSANWASLVSRKDSPASARAPDQPLLIKAPRREPGGRRAIGRSRPPEARKPLTTNRPNPRSPPSNPEHFNHQTAVRWAVPVLGNPQTVPQEPAPGRDRDAGPAFGNQWFMMNSLEFNTAHQTSWRAPPRSPRRATRRAEAICRSFVDAGLARADM